MTDAPERIWLMIDRMGKISRDPDAHVEPCDSIRYAYTPYISEARHQAELAAALEEAAKAINPPKFVTEDRKGYAEGKHEARHAVISLIPADARVVLDKLIADAVEAEREVCAALAETAIVDPGTNVYDAASIRHGDSIAAAIRNRGGEDG